MASEVGTPGSGRAALRDAAPGRLDHPAVWLFAAASLISLVVLVAMAPQLTFVLDDWAFLQFRVDPSWDAVMQPHNEHISIAPVLIYEALLHSFGMDSATSFRVVATLVFIAGVALLFVWVRRRVGDWLALAGTLPLLFFGAGAEDLLFPFQVGYFGSLAFGLAALLALERDDRAGDVLACLALVASLTFSSVGLPFLAGAAVCVAWDERRRRRAYLVAVPALLYLLWFIGWGREAESHLSIKTVLTAPSYVIDGFASSVGSLFGLAASRLDTDVSSLAWGRVLLLIAVGLAVWRLVRGPRPSRWLWVVLAIALAYWGLAAASAYFDARAPTTGRYQYVGAIFVVMIAVELVRGLPISRAELAMVFAVVAVSLAGNVSTLVDTYRALRTTSEIVRADLTALELARGVVPAEFQIDGDNGGTDFVGVQAGLYFASIDDVGSPAYTEAELRAAPDWARRNADKVSAAALGLANEPVAKSPAATGPAPTLVGPADATVDRRGPCATVAAPGQAEVVLALPAGSVSVAAGGSPATLSLRRYATDGFPVLAGQVAAGATSVLSIPADASTRPWQLALAAATPATVCGLGGPPS